MGGLTRPYDFAKNLSNYNCTIFSSSYLHYSGDDLINDNSLYREIKENDIPFVFIRTTAYKNSRLLRVKNMFDFYRNLFRVSKEYSYLNGNPDVIFASSAHPLTLIAGQKIAKEYGVPCICEVRDLWPESFVAYKIFNVKNPILKLLYLGEKWIYKKADKLVFTMEGGKDYIIHQRWDKEQGGPIDMEKVNHINNGVDLNLFEYNRDTYVFDDEDLDNGRTFKVIYAGSIRLVNNVKSIIDAAQVIKNKNISHIEFLIYGDGSDREHLEKYCLDNKIQNVKFKGFVDKKKIPYILSKSNLNILHFEQNNIKQYGASLNKLFEYFASGKPTVSDCEFGYDLIEKYNCGRVIDNANADQLADAIIHFSKMSKEEYATYCTNAIKAAHDYDFKVLSKKLEGLLK
jgi:glycosyltransferase involved in cell wall biosynthesis